MSDAEPESKPRRRKRPRGYLAAKAAQLAAYLLIRGGGEMQKLKLAKLLYLAERESALRHGHLMFHDRHFAAKHGPITSRALNGVDGTVDREAWSPNVELEGNVVRVPSSRTVDDLDRLSVAERRIADDLLARFGGRDGMTAIEIRDWTHKLPEYEAKEAHLRAGRDSVEITPRDLAAAIGHPDPDEFAEIDEEMRALASDPS